MMTPLFKAALGGAALWSVMLIAVTERDPPRPDASVPDPIAERWIPEPQLTELLRKSDRLPFPPIVQPAGPAAVSPAAEPLPSPAVTQPKTRARTNRHHASRDVCSRNHMRKVTTHGGRSWRCKH